MRVQSRHSSSKNHKFKRSLQIVFLAILFIVLGMLIPKAMSVVTAVVMYPIHATNVWLNESSASFPTYIRDKQSLQKEIESLKNRLAVDDGVRLTQQRLLEENNYLRKLLGVGVEKRVAAAVIARPNELPYDLLQIDRGTNQGVEVGAPVFVGQDVVIGLVVHTASDYSFVELVTTPGFEATAFISGPDVVATIEGYGGGIARVKVPQGVPMLVGNLVYLPSIEPGVFGRISYVENLPTQPEQYGYISSDVAISSLYQVAVGQLSQISHAATEVDSSILELIKHELLVEDVTVGVLDVATSSVDEVIDNLE